MLYLQQVGVHRCFEGSFKFDTSTLTNSDYIIIPPDVDRVSVQLYCASTASGIIQATCSTQTDIESGTALWKDWDAGSVTGGAVAQSATIGPVAAIIFVTNMSLAGLNATVSVRAQRGNP